MSVKSSVISVKSLGGSSDVPDDHIEDFMNEKDNVILTVDGFGTVKNPVTQKLEVVRRFTWNNRNGMIVQVITYGATITAMCVPNRHGVAEDVVLGFDDMDGYLRSNNPYFGCAVGRVANRINGGEFLLNGKKYNVAKNLAGGAHHLHGGVIGFDKFNWVPYVEGTVLRLTHISEDGFEGYPGTVLTTISYELKKDNSFSVFYSATSSRPTPINLTNHSYFNLGGHGSGHEEIYRHIITMNADKITETNDDSIPTGKLLCVGGTPFDLRVPKELGPAMAKLPGIGYDDNFCITKGTSQELAFVARVVHPNSGRVMEVYSDQPGVQLYTANYMPNPNKNIHPHDMNIQDYYDIANLDLTKLEPIKMVTGDVEQPIIGKSNAKYYKHGAFCLETQKFPDAVNHPMFPSTILNPGEVYKHETVFKFDALL